LDGGVQGEAAPETEDDEDRERRQQQCEQAHRIVANGWSAAQVPDATDHDDRERPGVAAPACGSCRREFAEVENKNGRIDGHIEDAGGEREPAFLIAPEGPRARRTQT